MNQKRTTKQALVTSVLTLMLCLCMLIGSTFAWFTDSVSSDKNVIVAGNLDIELEYYKDGAWTTVEGASDIFNPAAKWEPGHAEVAYLKASNLGNLALNYKLGVNLLGETKGINVEDEVFQLSDYLLMNIIEDVDGSAAAYADREAAIEAAKADGRYLSLNASLVNNNFNDGVVTGKLEAATDADASDEKYVAVVIWMPTAIGNEANFKTGTTAPSIDLGVSIIATQATGEFDGFGNDYDAGASFPVIGMGSANVPTDLASTASIPVNVRNTQNAKVGSFEVPAGAIADGVTALKGTIEETDAAHSNIDLATLDGYVLKHYNIDLVGIKEVNDTDVIVTIRIESGVAQKIVDENSIILYHNGVKMEGAIIDYDPSEGNLKFKTKSFSPFTVAYKIPTTTQDGTIDLSDLPVASLATAPQFVKGGSEADTIEWGKYGQWSPTAGLDAELEACYIFSTTETPAEVAENPFKNWKCDFVLSLDKDLGANEIFLGGNYGSFGWVGFHNGDLTLAANEEVYLLDSVADAWTYDEVADFVGTFICGAGDVDGKLAAKGATLTVTLRLWNPEKAEEKYDIAVVKHTFGTAFAQDVVDNTPNV
ncbi:MAG: hypothetical protein J6J66_04615 [Clostridia bacterium]|nr:hypothetical protein [Clostridia bacterium]